MTTRQEISRLGGLAVYAKYGKEHMQNIGRAGAMAFWKKYSLQPFQLTYYAIVERSTGKIIRILGEGFTRKA